MSQETPVFDDSAPRSTKAAARAARREAKKGQPPGVKALEAQTVRQGLLISALRAGRSVLAVGGAGTGKTYIPSRIAAQKLVAGQIEKIIVARPTVSDTRHGNGFLPGKLDQKLAPWLVPVIDAIRAEVSGNTLDQWKTEGRFEIASFEHMRGRTFANAFVILDEAQNCSTKDLRLFTGRIGKDTQVAIAGDTDQVDIRDSGLADLVEMVEDDRDLQAFIDLIQFTDEDVVRSAFAKAFVKAYARRKARPTDADLDRMPAFLHPRDH